ncbi:MAG: acyl carrier protein [Deltaproteobacteria bacterium]|jgi:acyl carrier protein
MITLDVLNGVFVEVFGDNSLVITRKTTANDVEDWDSLTHMNLVMILEKKFKIKFALGELQTLQNVGDMLDLINAKVSK